MMKMQVSLVARKRLHFIVCVHIMLCVCFNKAESKEAECKRLYPLHVETFVRYGASSIFIGHRSEVLVSYNFGHSWNVLGTLPTMTLIKQIVVLNKKNIVVNTSSSIRGAVYVSHDYGKSFHLSIKNSATNEALYYQRKKHLLYVVDNSPQLYVSRNFGKSWKPIGSHIPFKILPNKSHVCSLAAVVRKGQWNFYITTAYPGKIFRTENEGNSWSLLFSDVQFRLREIPVLRKFKDNCLFAVSAEGVIDAPGSILIGSTLGTNWKIVPAPEGFWSCDQSSDNAEIMLGGFTLGKNAGSESVFILHKPGLTWDRRTAMGSSLIWKVEFVQSDRWLMATDKGLLLIKIT